MPAPYYVNVYSGFLVVESYKTSQNGQVTKCFTTPDCRSASTFDSWDDADRTAKWAVGLMFPPDLRYFALLEVARMT